MKKRVLFISIGWEQEPLIKKLYERQDLELYGINYPGSIIYHECFKEIKNFDYRDLTSIFEYTESIMPHAVISDEDDYAMFLQALVAEKCQLIGPNVGNAQIACNKFLQRIKSAENNIKIPKFQLCKDIDDLTFFIDKVGLPIILKPVDSRGSIGVSKIENKKDVKEHFFKALSASPSFLTIAEEFIDGDHYNVDGYCFGPNDCKSIAVSENIKSKLSKGIVNESLVYGALDLGVRNDLLTLGSKIANALGYNFGFFHGEFIRSHRSGEFYLTEMANRGGGILISEVVLPYHTDSNLLDLYIDHCLGNSIDKVFIFKNQYCRIDFVSLEIGKVFKGIDKALFFKKYHEILDIVPFIKKDSEIKAVEDGSKRHIMIISTIENDAILNQIKSEIKLVCSA